jgi:hypothetical protein
MTISNDCQNLADHCLGFALRNEPIKPAGAARLAQVLMALADRVERLENIPMHLDSPEVRLGFHKLRERHDAE